jgi:peptidoglycan hydrolase CwlO-like protein
MLKQKLKKVSIYRLRSRAAAAFVASVLVAGMLYTGFVRADQYDEQIKQLQAQNAQSQAASNQLANQAQSYQDAINRLQQQIDSLERAIADNQQKSADLQKQIDLAQAQLDEQKKILGADIKAMYLEGQVSTLEILASSSNLSDFVDREQARSSVENKVTDTVKKITALQAQLKSQQNQLQALIKDQETQNAQLAATQSQQNQMLAYTEGQKAAYDAQIQNNNSQIASLRAQQAAANRSLGGQVTAGDPNHGGYPAYLDNAYQDSLIDPWGMYNRECVSYAAWKVQQTYGYMPYWGGQGNANQWPGDAQRYGIPTGYTPRVHSVAIWYTASALGHAMWVEAVSGNMVYVSQYNYDGYGHYSEMWVNGSNFVYIYFPG